ncbi:MAG: hypothetical protein ACJAZ2_001015 [Glaciecola sp.]|jgi:hypothetical protein
MKFVTRKDIDDGKWNACIKASSPYPYALSWYLDELCTWEALIIEEKGNYTACFPVPYKSKLGVKYVYPPFFIQQLGLFSVGKNVGAKQFIDLIANKYKWVELYLNKTVTGAEGRCNLILNLNKSHEELKSEYASNHKRNLKKSNKLGLSIKDTDEPGVAISLFKADKGVQFKHLKEEHYHGFLKVCETAKSKGILTVLTAVNQENKNICSALFLKNNNRIIFVFSGNTKTGKESAALFYILDEVIKRHQNTDVVLDFEGSENEGLQRFYKGFGASLETYYFLKYNNLPFPMNILKK